MNTTQWNVTKYGKLVERSDIYIKGVGVVTTKIYQYCQEEMKYYIEVWNNGYCVHFSEMID